MRTKNLLEYNGKPFIGNRTKIVDKDDPKTIPVKKSIVHTKQFNLNEEQALEDYNAVMQKVADGISVVSFEEKQYDSSIGSWRVLLRWLDIVYDDNPRLKQGSKK